MRTITKLIVTTAIITAGGFAYSILHKDKWFNLHQVNFQTSEPIRRTIVRKKVFSGSLIPHKEINLEAHVSGIVDKLFVHVGDYVQKGSPIARIKIIPSPKEIEAAESKVRLATINLNQARSKYLRSKQLFSKKMLAKEAYEANVASWEETKEKLAATQKQLEIARYGYTKAKGKGANLLKATTSGTILDLPIKEGNMVQAVNEKTSGTRAAVIADMDRFLFSAKVSELDVVHLTKGMTFTASLNAVNNEKLKVILTKISPKASEEVFNNKGEIKFAIEGIVEKPKKSKIILRAGYLAVAEVIIQQVDDVLSVPESMVETEGENHFIKCLSNRKLVKKKVILGLSDGLYVEVKEGLTEEDLLIVEA